MAKKRLAPLPVLKPGTYTGAQVLRHVAKLILAEPKRLDMSSYMGIYRADEARVSLYDELPRCGTVACAAGWIGVSIKDKRAATGAFDCPTAIDALGAYGAAAERLESLFVVAECITDPEDVAAELRAIAKEHGKQLHRIVVR